ncbi:hypothetical protein [Acidisoma sp. S159]|uniref:hypothetical protein n=1 Tax=Acidisoma sp. S159 TaxID=1747225 RepID=UPI00131D3BC3|nr:hypothetical protein [Acidisoma sp. S159]
MSAAKKAKKSGRGKTAAEKPEPVINPQSIRIEKIPLPIFVNWINEPSINLKTGKERLIKVPYKPGTGGRVKARADDPTTWGMLEVARASAPALMAKHGKGGGIGIELFTLTKNFAIGGIDLDRCMTPDESDPNLLHFSDWADEILTAFGTYAEISPSETGCKLYFLYDPTWLPELREAMGTQWSKPFKHPSGGHHPSAIEVHLGRHYFALTFDHVVTTPPGAVMVSKETLLKLLSVTGPQFAGVAPKERYAPEAAASTPPSTYGKALRAALLPVAHELLDNYNDALSRRTDDKRFGSYGSLSVKPSEGVWYDHENGEGGGVLELIERQLGTDTDGAKEYLKENGYLPDDDDDDDDEEYFDDAEGDDDES